MRNEERGTWNVIYYELLKPGETVNIVRYRQQMIDLNQASREKRPEYQRRQHKVILLHDNAPSHTAKPVKETIKAFSWEIPSHAAYSPDLALSDYYLFASMTGLPQKSDSFFGVASTVARQVGKMYS